MLSWDSKFPAVILRLNCPVCTVLQDFMFPRLLNCTHGRKKVCDHWIPCFKWKSPKPECMPPKLKHESNYKQGSGAAADYIPLCTWQVQFGALTLPLTLCIGSTTTATARSDRASKLCCVLMSTPDNQQPKPGCEWYQPTTISGLQQTNNKNI